MNVSNRELILNSILDIIYQNGYDINTFHLIVSIIDRYLINKEVDFDRHQVIALICIMIIGKAGEFRYLQIKDIQKITNFRYSIEKLIELEAKILYKLGFRVHDKTMIEHLTEKNASDLSKYLSSIILFLNEYTSINSLLMTDKIMEFASIISEESININLIKENNVYLFIYSKWKQTTHIHNLKNFHEQMKQYQSILDSIDVEPLNRGYCLFEKNNNNLNLIPCYSYASIENSRYVRSIGKGAFGIVKHIIIDNKEIAFKFNKERSNETGIDVFILHEFNILCLLDHPSIVKLDGFYYNHRNCLSGIGLSLMNYSLEDRIKYGVNQETKMKYIIQLLEGVKYLHEQKIMHRDLSVRNIMIDHYGNLKIIDFGQSKYFYNLKDHVILSRAICSLFSRPIEILLGKKNYDFKIDVWSCACIIGFILIGQHMFVEYTEPEIIDKIFSILGTPTDDTIKEWSLFPKDVKRYPRIGLEKLEEIYPKHTEILYQMLEYIPKKRILIGEALDSFRALQI